MMAGKLKLVLAMVLVFWLLLIAYLAFTLDWFVSDSSLSQVVQQQRDKQKLVLEGVKHVNHSKPFFANNIEPVQVVLATDDHDMLGMMAAVNSIAANAKSGGIGNVHFYLITSPDSLAHAKTWIEESKLSKINYKLAAFPKEWVEGKISRKTAGGRTAQTSTPPNPTKLARFYVPKLFPDLKGRFAYLDSDVIVQGDIAELLSTPIEPDSYGAFSSDCKSVSKRLINVQDNYANFVNFNNPAVKDLGMNPTACAFDAGVFVTSVEIWNKFNLTEQLEKWMELNSREEVYGSQYEGDSVQPPMMIVFYKRISRMDPMWNVRHLGVSGGSRYYSVFLLVAKLLHWDGHLKPWGPRAANMNLWDKYYVPDPSHKFYPVRKGVQRSL